MVFPNKNARPDPKTVDSAYYKRRKAAAPFEAKKAKIKADAAAWAKKEADWAKQDKLFEAQVKAAYAEAKQFKSDAAQKRLARAKDKLEASKAQGRRFAAKQKATKESIVESQGASRKKKTASKFAKIRAKTTPGRNK